MTDQCLRAWATRTDGALAFAWALEHAVTGVVDHVSVLAPAVGDLAAAGRELGHGTAAALSRPPAMVDLGGVLIRALRFTEAAQAGGALVVLLADDVVLGAIDACMPMAVVAVAEAGDDIVGWRERHEALQLGV